MIANDGNIMSAFAKLVSFGIFSSVVWPAFLQAGEVVAGRVEAHHGNEVRLCFVRGGGASIGEQFTLSRHVIWSQPKGAAVIRPQTVGAVKIDALGSDRCASATLIRGSAEPSDWVVRGDDDSRLRAPVQR